jgi:hypothetical protein
MTELFRGMKEGTNGTPEIGESSRTLGVRPGFDVATTDPGALVGPGQGGMSVSPDDPHNLPYFRRPPALGGTAKDAVWSISEGNLGPDLCYRPDPTRSGHGFVEPSRFMTLAEYQQALTQTQHLWHKT